MGLPAIVTSAGVALYEAAPVIRAAVARITLPAISAGEAAARNGILSRLSAAYGALPQTAKAIMNGTAVAIGVSAVTDFASAMLAAQKSPDVFGVLIMNYAQSGLNPDDIAPPEYVAKLGASDRNLFDNARAAYAAFVATHGSDSVNSSVGALDSTSARVDAVELVRDIARLFAVHSAEGVLSLHKLLQRFQAASATDIAAAATVIKASGGRL